MDSSAISATMTCQSFIERLREIRGRFDWRLEPDHTSPGAEHRQWTRYRVRAVRDEGDLSELILDPVTAVCYETEGTLCDSWTDAARVLGLDASDARDLIAAADDRTWEEATGRRRPDTRLQALRVEIIRAVERPGEAAG